MSEKLVVFNQTSIISSKTITNLEEMMKQIQIDLKQRDDYIKQLEEEKNKEHIEINNFKISNEITINQYKMEVNIKFIENVLKLFE